MSHELRHARSNAIIGFSEIMGQRQLFRACLGSDKYQEYCHDIFDRRANTCSRSSTTSSDMSKIEAGPHERLDMEAARSVEDRGRKSVRVVSGARRRGQSI